MSDFDTIIGDILASRNSLRQALALAAKVGVPRDDIATLETALATIEAQIDRMYSLAMNHGAPEPFAPARKIVLRNDEE